MQRFQRPPESRPVSPIQPRTVTPVHERHPAGNWQWLEGWATGEPVFIVAGGPSLIGVDLTRIAPYKTFAVNRSWKHCRFDAIVFLDAEMKADLPGPYEAERLPPYRIISGTYGGLYPGDNVTTFFMGRDYNLDPNKPVLGRTSSTMLAISAALIAGASHVFVLGLDCKFLGGKDHFYEYPKNLPHGRNNPAQYERMAGVYSLFAPGANRIYNLSPDSAVTAFRKISLDEALTMR